MRYRAKVTVISSGKAYAPGSILPDGISNTDLAFLKRKGFIEAADVAQAAFEDMDDYLGLGNGEAAGEEGLDGFCGFQPRRLKSPDEIRRIRSKKDVAAYAATIGMDLGDSYEEKSLKDLQASVADFQEEQMDSGDWSERA